MSNKRKEASQNCGAGNGHNASVTLGCELGPNVHISRHPVLGHKVSVLRSSSTLTSAFRAVLREVTFYLGYEATADLTTRPKSLTVPIGDDHVEATGRHLKEKIALIPKMRSGLGMVDSMLELLPNAEVFHIGMYKKDHLPVMYYNRLPKVCNADVAYILDPVVGSASTMMSIVGLLKKWGVPKVHIVCVIGSKKGILKLTEAHPDIIITVGEIDDKTNEEGMVIPGLGDAGDRLFRTPHFEDEESLLHVSKRKRSDA